MLKIFTFAHQRPDFIGMQSRSFQKHLQEDFAFTVFNNAAFDIDRRQHGQIQSACAAAGVAVVDVQKDQEIVDRSQARETGPVFHNDGTYHNANVACAYPLCWAWERIISKENDVVCIIDSDMFLVQPVNLTGYMQKYQLGFVPQARVDASDQIVVEYMWNALVLANLPQLPQAETIDWWCGQVRGVPVDVGGQTYRYLESHPNLTLLHLRASHIKDDLQLDFHPSDYEFLWAEDKPAFLHYRSGSNWNQRTPEYHEKKTRWLQSMLEGK